jgi:hypothetical protein
MVAEAGGFRSNLLGAAQKKYFFDIDKSYEKA